jgi:hypothetical protein
MRRKSIGVSLVAAVGLALAGCSSSAAPSSSTTTTSSAGIAPSVSTTAAPNVQSLLLSINDLPTGWTVDNSANSPGSLSCVPADLAHGSLHHADISFAQNGSLPILDESLGIWASAASVFAGGVTALNRCKAFTTTGSGTNYSGTLGAMSSPTYGDQSAAYNANLTIQGLDVNEGFVVVRKGSYIALVVLGDIGSLDSPTLQEFVTKAVAKIPG